ncbi:MAG: FAD-dependent oxidoreductase [Prolixibacteraceae bacterium]
MKAKLNRRDFLSLSLPATGAILIAPGLMNFQAMAEINRQFSHQDRVDEYDVVINGAGFSGYFAAIEASQKGLKVLVVEKRPSPGYEITAKRKTWLRHEGFDTWDTEVKNLFFPEQEKQEIFRKGGDGPNNSRFDDELLLFAGSVKKGLLRNLLVNRVHVLLMTDVCGLISDGKNVSGVMLACKHGLFSVKCRNFIDASDQLIFSRDLLGQQYRITHAGFVLELLNAENPQKKTIAVPAGLGLLNNRIMVHPGKNAPHQLLVEYQFPVTTQGIEEIELQSRTIAKELGRSLPEIDASLRQAKVHYYAYESSVVLEPVSLPQPVLDGHTVLTHGYNELSCSNVAAIRQAAVARIAGLRKSQRGAAYKTLHLVGTSIRFKKVVQNEPTEPGLAISLRKCELPLTELIRNEKHGQVLVAGGGTSGAAAAMGASEKGSQVTVVDYFNDPGGTKTMGGVMGYYHGLTDNLFIKFIETDSERFSKEINFNKKPCRQIYLLDRFSEMGAKFLPGAIICGAIKEDRKVAGILVSRNGKLEAMTADVVIDATGDGDVASFAGAEFDHGNQRNRVTQNYSQWNLQGGGTPPYSTNSDYDIIDNTKISELQRGLFLSHYEAHFYDFHPYLTVRESRRIKGLYELTLIDAAEGTHFNDLIGLASSDYDPHFVGYSEFTRCGFLLPHSNIVTVEIPFRSIIPKDLSGILISGKAFSQTQNASQFTRMSADLTALGYLTGQIAAEAANRGLDLKTMNISSLQEEWYAQGYLPKSYAAKKAGPVFLESGEIESRIENLAQGKKEFLYACCKLPKEAALPPLSERFQHLSDPEGKLLTAKALAWFGDASGEELIQNELTQLCEAEQADGYPGGYIDTYDDIRGREQNVLEGLFWRINQNIALLSMANSKSSTPLIKRILENTTSGGGMVPRENSYFNERIDLRIIPFYNRILNLCFYAERVPATDLNAGFETLLKDENIGSFATEEYHDTRWRVYGGLLELNIAAALARCGSAKGYHLLVTYLNDIHSNFREFARSELSSLLDNDFQFDQNLWTRYINTRSFPQACRKLVKEVEL